MRTIANILWHILFMGFITAFITFIVGSLLVLTVVAAPIGLGLIQFARFQMTPFSSCMVSKDDLSIEQNPLFKTYSFLIKILYLPFGIIAFIIGIFQVAGLCVTIVGIPLAIVIAKSLTTYLQPVGKVCVPVEVADAINARKNANVVSRYLD